MITSQSVTKGKPQTQLDWAGRPMKQGEYYNGRPEHWDPKVRNKEGMTPEKLATLRENMTRAREMLQRKKEVLRRRRELRYLAKQAKEAARAAKPDQAT